MHRLVSRVACIAVFFRSIPPKERTKQGNADVMKKSYMLHPQAVKRNWWLVDAKDQVLGRICTQVATLLKGKHKPTYTPHVENGDHVVVINADRIVLTGNKWNVKKHHRTSGRPGGLTSVAVTKLKAEKPSRIIEHAVRGMLPKTHLGRKMFNHLLVYAGESHPHGAQRPQPLKIKGE